jgi:hypothetical protein
MGISIFQSFRSYNNLIDDAEWLLERTPQRSRGFLIRPVSRCEQDGLWIGEYGHGRSQIDRQDLIFSKNALSLSNIILDYSDRKIAGKAFMKKISVQVLKQKLKSRIIQDFKYYICPTDRFYKSCIHIEKVYEQLTKKYGKGLRIPYSQVAEEIEKTKPCEEVIVCPLMIPNLFERVLNLNKALKSRKLGETKLVDRSDTVEII